MQATGVPSASSETRKPSGSAAWKAAASSSPGFHPFAPPTRSRGRPRRAPSRGSSAPAPCSRPDPAISAGPRHDPAPPARTLARPPVPRWHCADGHDREARAATDTASLGRGARRAGPRGPRDGAPRRPRRVGAAGRAAPAGGAAARGGRRPHPGAPADPPRADARLTVRVLPRRRDADGGRPRRDAAVGPGGPALRRRAPVELRRLRCARSRARLRHQRLRRDGARPVGVGRQAAGGEHRDRGARARPRRRRAAPTVAARGALLPRRDARLRGDAQPRALVRAARRRRRPRARRRSRSSRKEREAFERRIAKAQAKDTCGRCPSSPSSSTASRASSAARR